MVRVKPFVSIIILNYNGRKILGENCLLNCVSSVLSSDYPSFEVILVDNGSDDGSLKLIKETFKSNKLKIIANSKNYGFSIGNNMALKYAKGDYVALLNNDIEVKPDWLSELIEVMENDSTIGIAQSKIISMDRITIQTVGNVLDSTLSTHHIGFGEKDKGQYDKVCEITFASGAAMVIRKSLINKIGLFDPNYFFYHDDCDLGWRARLAGFKVVCVPSSVVYHKGKGTSSSIFTKHQHLYFLLASRIGLFLKNLELKSMLKLGPLVFISISLDVLAMLINGDFKTPLKLLFGTVKNFKHNWRLHQIVQYNIRKVRDSELFCSFLDLSIFTLRFRRYFDKIAKNNVCNRFDKFVKHILRKYYYNHLYK